MVSFNRLECLTLIFFLITLVFVNCAESQNTSEPIVTIPQGTLSGTTLTTRYNRNIFAFLGIPYAQPPIGDLRFADPVADEGWTDTLIANTDANACPQMSGDSVLGDEDCLYINVYTPQLPDNSSSSLLPVMVNIHGGAFQIGSAASTARGPQFLLDKDVVFVAGNYRLGLLGFLSTGDDVASGNWGLKDQILALEWVQTNVKYFGGDPNQVTLFGESAAGASIHLLSLSDATIGLFHRYITESGSALATWAHRPRGAYASRAFELGEYVGCSNETSTSLITCLRAINSSDIMAMDSQVPKWATFANIIWGPTDEPDIKGAVLTDSPSNLVAAGKIRDLPWISGVVRDEGLLMTRDFYEDEAAFDEFLQNIDADLPYLSCWSYLSDSGSAWLSAAKSYYFNNDLTTNKSELVSNLTMLMSDSQFFYPAHKSVQQYLSLAKNPQYFYTFNYRGTFTGVDVWYGSSANYGVAHADELLYLFPIESLNSEYSEADFEMVDIMIDLWTSFAINGTPSTLAQDGAITWDPYSTKDNYLRIGNESDPSLEVQYSFYEERMQFWAALESGTVTIHPNSFFKLLLPSLILCLLLNEHL